jgi:AraC family transcriptional activator of pobA
VPRSTAAPLILDFDPGIPAPLRLAVTRFDGSHPGVRQPPHAHRFFELIYVDDGRGSHCTGEVEIDVGPGDLIVIAPGEMHDPAGLASVQGWVLLFGARAIDASLTDADLAFAVAPPRHLAALRFLRPGAHAHEPLHLPEHERAALCERLQSIARELDEKRLGWEEIARAELRIVLVQCARVSAAQRPGPEGEGASRLLEEVLRYIDANFHRPISLADVAKAVHRSRAYLTDRVRRDTGRTVGAWITERRLAEARRLLLETDWDVGRIARSLTFHDGDYFARLFKRHHGLAPGAWRARMH